MPILWANQQSEFNLEKLNLVSFRSSCISTGVVTVAWVCKNVMKSILISKYVNFHMHTFFQVFPSILFFFCSWSIYLFKVQIMIFMVYRAVITWLVVTTFVSRTEDKNAHLFHTYGKVAYTMNYNSFILGVVWTFYYYSYLKTIIDIFVHTKIIFFLNLSWQAV